MKRFGKFWWDFVVGDDWRVAVGIVIAFGLTALLATTSIPAWWVLPPAGCEGHRSSCRPV